MVMRANQAANARAVSKHSRASHGNYVNPVSAAEFTMRTASRWQPGGYATSSFDNMNFDRDHLSEGIFHPPPADSKWPKSTCIRMRYFEF